MREHQTGRGIGPYVVAVRPAMRQCLSGPPPEPLQLVGRDRFGPAPISCNAAHHPLPPQCPPPPVPVADRRGKTILTWSDPAHTILHVPDSLLTILYTQRVNQCQQATGPWPRRGDNI